MSCRLQRADDADDRMAGADLRHEDLQQAFFGELPHRLVEALVAHVGRAAARQTAREETAESAETHRRAGVQRVADRELARIDEADDVAGYASGTVSRSRPKKR